MKQRDQHRYQPPAPNPQGKGQVAVLNDWQQQRPQQIVAKDEQQLLVDFFTSMLVLCADFQFKPVVGNRYFLYYKAGRWQLSLIEPQRWDAEKSGEYFASCQLHPDMTWSVNPATTAMQSEILQTAVQQFARHTYQHIQQHAGSHDLLPVYARQLPYYRRLAASALARSLQLSAGSDIPALEKALPDGHHWLVGNYRDD